MDEAEKIEFDIFRGLVCGALERHDLIDKIDCHPWEFASCLDMSFEEIKSKSFDLWPATIEKDVVEFMQGMH